MNNKLEPNMYVRTNGGNISKIENFKSSIYNDFIETPYKELINKKDIKKASHNIIDLIEVGDYVNGHEVKSKQSGVKRIDIGEDENYVWLYENDIKSIVTKEQFENMEYRIGE